MDDYLKQRVPCIDEIHGGASYNNLKKEFDPSKKVMESYMLIVWPSDNKSMWLGKALTDVYKVMADAES